MCKNCFISAQEIVYPVCIFPHLLIWIRWYFFWCVAILVDVAYFNIIRSRLAFINNHKCHKKILFESCWKNTISAVVYVFANNINSSWRSSIKLRQAIVKHFESIFQILPSRFMCLFDWIIRINIHIIQRFENWHGFNGFTFHF